MFPFDEETDPKLRHEILLRHLGEVLTDRERARLYGLPEGCRIRERAKILAPEKFTCGRNLWIGEGAMLDAQGGLTIGDNTQIGLNTMIWSHRSYMQALSGETGASRDKIEYAPTRIGSNCFIAGPSVIGPGVTIGDGVIVEPLTFVDYDVPDGAAVGPKMNLRESRREVKRLERRVKRLEEALIRVLDVVSTGQGADALQDLQAIRSGLEST